MPEFLYRKDLCELLKNKGLLTDIQIKKVESVVSATKKNVEDVIVSLNFLTDEQLLKAISEYMNIPFKKIDPLKLKPEIVTRIIPGRFAEKHQLIVIDKDDHSLTVAIANPFDRTPIDDVQRMSGLSINLVLTTKDDIRKIVNEFYKLRSSLIAAERELTSDNLITEVDISNLERLTELGIISETDPSARPIIQALNHLLNYAFDQRASDIHIEPKRRTSLVRFRIDGILHNIREIADDKRVIHKAIISRIKAMSGLDIAERRRPQDGRIKTTFNNKEIELRVSIMPTIFGEKAVIRIFDPEVFLGKLEELGLSNDDLPKFYDIINRPHGILLVTGPTGSGKTTTLYSVLRYLSTSEVNVISIEDPVELVQEEFNQVAVHHKIGFNFANALRTILRQDPDIIMVGEIRDRETAENAIQAALTGHFVLSTVHTNDAPSTITRLIDMKVPSFLISSTVAGIIAQRLVRKICLYCKEPHNITENELKLLNPTKEEREKILSAQPLFKGKGCFVCRNTGYYGRSAVFEIMLITDTLKELIRDDVSADVLRNQARKEGMNTLREDGIKKILDGTTTIEEVAKVIKR